MNSTFYSGLQFSPCDHILDSDAARKLANHTKILGILSIATPVLSIIGSGSVIVFVIYHKICRSPDVNSFFHLSIADLLLSLFWFVGPIMHFSFHIYGGPATTLGTFCVVWQALCEMVHIMSFFLTINYAFNVFLRMKEKKARIFERHVDVDICASQERFRHDNILKTSGYVLSWLVPVFLIIPLLCTVMKQESSCQMCIILLDAPRPTHGDELLAYNGFVLMIATLGFSIIAIIVLYFCTLRMYRQTLQGFHTNRERVVIHAMAKRATAYIIVFVYCWTPALVLSSMGLYQAYNKKEEERDVPQFEKHFALYVFQTLSAPLQGFLNSLVYGWSRKTFREAVTRESRHWLDYPRYGTMEESPSSSLLASTEIKTPVVGRPKSRK